MVSRKLRQGSQRIAHGSLRPGHRVGPTVDQSIEAGRQDGADEVRIDPQHVYGFGPAGGYHSGSGHWIRRIQANPPAQVVARTGRDETERGGMATEQVLGRAGVDPEVHHAVAAHHGEHVDTVRDRVTSHLPRFSEVPAEQDLHLQPRVAEAAGDVWQHLLRPALARRRIHDQGDTAAHVRASGSSDSDSSRRA